MSRRQGINLFALIIGCLVFILIAVVWIGILATGLAL